MLRVMAPGKTDVIESQIAASVANLLPRGFPRGFREQGNRGDFREMFPHPRLGGIRQQGKMAMNLLGTWEQEKNSWEQGNKRYNTCVSDILGNRENQKRKHTVSVTGDKGTQGNFCGEDLPPGRLSTTARFIPSKALRWADYPLENMDTGVTHYEHPSRGGALNGCLGREVRLGRSNPDPVYDRDL